MAQSILSAELPSASFLFCFSFSVHVSSPYRSDRGTPGGAPPCRHLPFNRAAAGVLQAPISQKKDWKFTGHPILFNCTQCTRQRRSGTLVPAYFWLLFLRGKSNPGRGAGGPAGAAKKQFTLPPLLYQYYLPGSLRFYEILSSFFRRKENLVSLHTTATKISANPASIRPLT